MNGIPKGFKVIPDFPGYYINKIGEVWSGPKQGNNIRGVFLNWRINNRGYLWVKLRKEGREFTKMVHRLVLETFTGPCPEGKEGCHKNDTRIDNELKNLYWGTRSENQLDAFRNGRQNNKGELHPRAKLNNWQVRIIRHLKTFTHQEIAKIFCVSRSTIVNVRLGKTWKHL